LETTARDDILSKSEMSQEMVGPLNRESSIAHAAVESIAGAADDAARRVNPAIDRVAAMAHHAVDTAANVVAPTADWLAERGATLKVTQKRLLSHTCNFVAENPLKAVGIAAVVGFAFCRALLVFRDSKRVSRPPSP
jgi:ElaB/YqjD/DUF883 family membrane-anchored ribosome-binding protein